MNATAGESSARDLSASTLPLVLRPDGERAMSRYPRAGIGHDETEDDLDSRFRRPLLAYFLKRIHNFEEAEDLTQEAFIRLARRRDPYGTGQTSQPFTPPRQIMGMVSYSF